MINRKIILLIDSAHEERVRVALKSGEETIAAEEFAAKYRQAETLLPAIAELLKQTRRKLSDISRIEVADEGGTFTALRIGIVTANTLGFALGVPVKPVPKSPPGEGCHVPVTGRVVRRKAGQQFDVVLPQYDQEPNITKQKQKGGRR